MGRDRYRIGDPAAPHFLTCTALLWLPLFAQPANAKILLDSLQYLQTEGGLTLYGHVILENHCHLLGCSRNIGKTMARMIRCIGGIPARAIMRGRRG